MEVCESISCPFCGQHIEYTAGYCGKQMQCPICGQTVTFPALPPGGKSGPKLRVKSLSEQDAIQPRASQGNRRRQDKTYEFIHEACLSW